jgi:hypothetical protein
MSFPEKVWIDTWALQQETHQPISNIIDWSQLVKDFVCMQKLILQIMKHLQSPHSYQTFSMGQSVSCQCVRSRPITHTLTMTQVASVQRVRKPSASQTLSMGQTVKKK